MSSILVGHGEIEAVFSGFGQNDGKRVGGEILEFINIEIERAAILDIFDVRARHGGELNGCNEEGAKNTGVIFTY